ncbi:hypothetical protein ACOMHN_029633 [Nucella lapillus]
MQSKKDEKTDELSVFPKMLEDVDGVLLPGIFPINRPVKEHVQLIKSMTMRPDDILVLAYPKSGTHFLWEVTCMLVAGKAEYEKRSKVFSMMEAMPFEDFDSAPSPRILNTHLPIRFLPQQIKEKKVKVINVYRNVKDVLVSSYFHYKQISGSRIETLEDLEGPLISGPAVYGTYIDYMKQMWDYREKNPDVPVFTLSFEDMKEDPEKMVGKLAKFLGVDASPEMCADIAQATSFSKMKEADKSKKYPDNIAKQEIYRRGEVGDWKNYMTVAQSERLEAAITQLQSCDYNIRSVFLKP